MSIKQYEEVMERWWEALLKYDYNEREKCLITIQKSDTDDKEIMVDFEYINVNE